MHENKSNYIDYYDFTKVDMRVGKIIEVENFPEARKPAYKVTIDFGSEIGIMKSSAQITNLYSKEDLLERKVVCTVNLAPKQIGPFTSECLIMGADDEKGNVSLLEVSEDILPGKRIY